MVETLPPPHVLKIDVEGHETAVLRGMQRLLSGDYAPLIIQIEYGDTYLPSGSTLKDVYSLLPGYSIGRLFPNHVDFRPYSYADDHFRMGNIIATRDARLKSLLA